MVDEGSASCLAATFAKKGCQAEAWRYIRQLQVQNVAVGHAGVIYVARGCGPAAFGATAARTGNIHTALGGTLAHSTVVIRSNHRDPLVKYSFATPGNAWRAQPQCDTIAR